MKHEVGITLVGIDVPLGRTDIYAREDTIVISGMKKNKGCVSG